MYGLKKSIVTAIVKKYIASNVNEKYLTHKMKKLFGEFTEQDFKDNRQRRKIMSVMEPIKIEKVQDKTGEFVENSSYFANPTFSSLRNSYVSQTPKRPMNTRLYTLKLKNKLQTSKL